MKEKVKINANDFSHKGGFDGFPFSDKPDWLMDCIESGEIKVLDPNPNCTDYALWEINTSTGKEIGNPGDFIFYKDSKLRNISKSL